MAKMLFSELANLCEMLKQTTSKLQLVDLMAQFLRRLEPEEIGAAVLLIIGRALPEQDSRTLEVSGSTVMRVLRRLIGERKDLSWAFGSVEDFGEAIERILRLSKQKRQLNLLPFDYPPLRLLEVYQTFEKIAEVTGKDSRKKKEGWVQWLLERASPVEAKYIVKNLTGEMRHGVSEGLVLEAIAAAAQVNGELVRRANMVSGDLAELARLALTQGEKALKAVSITLFRPLKPMLAQVAKTVEEAYREHNGAVALEYKLDGARVQIHKKANQVRIFSRRLSDVTESLPEIEKEVKERAKAKEAVFEGEVIAVGQGRKPLPFQELLRRFRRVHEVEEMKEEIPVELYLFDLLYLDGKMLIDLPYKERWELLKESAGSLLLVNRILPKTMEEGERFLRKALKDGHEGVMAKYLESRYTPGARGKLWFKIKPAISLDLVIVAADWGYGRRKNWLSNYHLAARDEETGEFMEVGKTFKGLTDEEFEWMTKRLQELQISQSGGTVFVKPELVVEVLFNEIQKSPTYKSGLALRFARISRIREDKSPQDAETIQRMRQLFQRQFQPAAGKTKAIKERP